MRAARSNPLPFLRAFLAALLTLALLSVALPFAALSAAHSCSMPCCAGGSCATGACEGALFKKPKKSVEEKLCGTEGAHLAHTSARESASSVPVKASTNSDHCHAGAEEISKAEQPNAAREEQAGQTNQASARALASPCSKDCCAGASAFSPSKRGRDSGAIFRMAGTPPTDSISLSLYSQPLPVAASGHLRRLRARAPPQLYTLNPA